jgi:hypothetical protein
MGMVSYLYYSNAVYFLFGPLRLQTYGSSSSSVAIPSSPVIPAPKTIAKRKRAAREDSDGKGKDGKRGKGEASGKDLSHYERLWKDDARLILLYTFRDVTQRVTRSQVFISSSQEDATERMNEAIVIYAALNPGQPVPGKWFGS